MKSPFPGMDPYLEPHWLDVHNRLVTYTADWLNEHLPDDLIASTEERVAIDAEGDVLHRIGPDVRVFTPSTTDPAESGPNVIHAPFKLLVDLDPIVEPYVRVIDASGQLISVIEYLSPSNKRGEGLDAYRTKRDELLSAGIHVVEIDLVRGGNWRSLLQPARVPPDAISPYRAIVRQGQHRLAGYLFPISFDRPSDDIPVPLRPTDANVLLPLQALIDQAYERGRYRRRLNYSEALDPPLDAAETDVLERTLREAGLR